MEAANRKTFLQKFIRWTLWVFISLFILLNALSAVHAYKFTHYYDSLPAAKPAAERTWWDNAKPLITGINAAKKKITEYPSRPYETVWLETKDKIRLEAWNIKVDSAIGTIIMFHGHGNNKAGILKEAEAFWQMGFNTFMIDFRAHGNSSGNTTTIGAKETEDVLAAYNYIKPATDKPVILYGVSMGAAAVLHAMEQTNIDPDKLILEMPFGSLKEAAEGRLKLMHVPAEPMGTLLTFWGGIENGFWAFDYKPCMDARTVDCPVLLQWGAKDPRVKRSETECIYRNLYSGDKQLVVYDEAGHESLLKKQPEKWMRTVSRFLQDTTSE